MARLVFGPPPDLQARSHRDYLPWLAHRCYDRACAYCLESGRVLEVDHVEPVTRAKDRARDPTNLLPACASCNGPTGKWDYHPEHAARRARPDDRHGWAALDPRTDDLATLYALRDDGSLQVLPGPEHDRALWNCEVLFQLNRTNLRIWRYEARQIAAVAEHLIGVAHDAGPASREAAIRRRDVIVREVARRLLLFELLDLPLSDELRRLAAVARDAARGPVPGGGPPRSPALI